MILQWRNTIKVSIELPVATRHRHDVTEKLLKATLNPNKWRRHKGFSHYTGHSRHTNQMLRFDPRFVQLSASGSWDSGFESLLRHIYHLTERDTRRLTCTASDGRDKGTGGQDNVTNINSVSGVRRIICEQRYINENVLTPKCPCMHPQHFFGYSHLRLQLKFLVCILASYSDGVWSGSTVCVYRNFYQRFKKKKQITTPDAP